MKYRAICPGCGAKFPRTFYFKWLPHVRRCCDLCGCTYMVNSWWEWIGSGVLGLSWAVFALLALFGVMSWFIAVPLILAVFIAGYILFPYITPFDLIQDAKKHEGTSA